MMYQFHVFSFNNFGVFGTGHHIIKYKKGKQNDGKKIERTDGRAVSAVSAFCRFAAARATQQAALRATAD
jgi:ribosomal protein L44E